MLTSHLNLEHVAHNATTTTASGGPVPTRAETSVAALKLILMRGWAA